MFYDDNYIKMCGLYIISTLGVSFYDNICIDVFKNYYSTLHSSCGLQIYKFHNFCVHKRGFSFVKLTLY